MTAWPPYNGLSICFIKQTPTYFYVYYFILQETFGNL